MNISEVVGFQQFAVLSEVVTVTEYIFDVVTEYIKLLNITEYILILLNITEYIKKSINLLILCTFYIGKQ